LGQHVKRVHPKSRVDLEGTLGGGEAKTPSEAKGHSPARPLSTGTKRIIALILIIVVGTTSVYAYNALTPKPSLYADHSKYDLGKVGQRKYSHTFTFTNEGSGDLTVDRIWTSCGCTTAKVVLFGIESPEFGMPGHGGSTGPWEAKLKRGDTASLVVYYDSTEMPDLYHGDRYVFVDSNDPVNPEFQFTITVEEVP